jgi:hypothetical protein
MITLFLQATVIVPAVAAAESASGRSKVYFNMEKELPGWVKWTSNHGSVFNKDPLLEVRDTPYSS